MANQQDTEERILIAATEVFIQKGKDGAKMQDIADHAKINKALLHYYFRTKDQLYYIVFEKLFTGILRSFSSSVPFDKDFKTTLKTFLDMYIDAISKNRFIFRFFLWEIQEGGDKIGVIIPRVFANLGFHENPFIAAIQHAIDTKQIRKVDPAHLFISIVSLSVGPFVAKPIIEKIVPELQMSLSDYANERKKAVFDLIWNGIKFENI
jgi:TetR/AcrR family transcriptional regulator